MNWSPQGAVSLSLSDLIQVLLLYHQTTPNPFNISYGHNSTLSDTRHYLSPGLWDYTPLTDLLFLGLSKATAGKSQHAALSCSWGCCGESTDIRH